MSKIHPESLDLPSCNRLEVAAHPAERHPSCDTEGYSSFATIRLESVDDRSTASLFGPDPWFPFRGLKKEFVLRLGFYPSDFVDGIKGPRTIQKLLSTIAFLYFACLLPDVAFGALNDDNTNGGLNVRKVIIAQGLGGIIFSLLGGQPMIILLSTAPLALYIKLIYSICEDHGYDFFAMYACVGLFCCIFLIIYSVTELGSLMKFSTRSMEEIFSLFIAIDFASEGIRAARRAFLQNYVNCEESVENLIINGTVATFSAVSCHKETAVLFLLLMLGTLWFGMFFYSIRKTSFFTRTGRDLIADYALPAAVLLMSFTGSFLFSSVAKDSFKMREEIRLIQVANIFSLPASAYFLSLLLGFSLSFLFYIDQNVTSALCSNPENKLKKGETKNLDLFVVAILNMFLSVLGLPWVHGALPHSPLHCRALADVEVQTVNGHQVEVVTNVRETRLAALIAHILILLSAFFLIPNPLQLIPTSVLYGLFLYVAITSLPGNTLFERILLLFTEKTAFPKNEATKLVPSEKMHLFTGIQLIQLLVFCIFGFFPYPYVQMAFPVVCILLIPIRHTVIPLLLDRKYLDILDKPEISLPVAQTEA